MTLETDKSINCHSIVELYTVSGIVVKVGGHENWEIYVLSGNTLDVVALQLSETIVCSRSKSAAKSGHFPAGPREILSRRLVDATEKGE